MIFCQICISTIVEIWLTCVYKLLDLLQIQQLKCVEFKHKYRHWGISDAVYCSLQKIGNCCHRREIVDSSYYDKSYFRPSIRFPLWLWHFFLISLPVLMIDIACIGKWAIMDDMHFKMKNMMLNRGNANVRDAFPEYNDNFIAQLKIRCRHKYCLTFITRNIKARYPEVMEQISPHLYHIR